MFTLDRTRLQSQTYPLSIYKQMQELMKFRLLSSVQSTSTPERAPQRLRAQHLMNWNLDEQAREFSPEKKSPHTENEKTIGMLPALCSRYHELRQQESQPEPILISSFVYDLIRLDPFYSRTEKVALRALHMLLEQNGFRRDLESLETAWNLSRNLLVDVFQRNQEIDPTLWHSVFLKMVVLSYGPKEPVKKLLNTRNQILILAKEKPIFKMDDLVQIIHEVSRATIKNALNMLKNEGILELSGAGRGACWRLAASHRPDKAGASQSALNDPTEQVFREDTLDRRFRA